MNNSTQERQFQRSNHHISNSDSAIDADHSSPEARRNYHRTSSRLEDNLPPIAHRRSPGFTSKTMSDIKSKCSDGATSPEPVVDGVVVPETNSTSEIMQNDSSLQSPFYRNQNVRRVVANSNRTKESHLNNNPSFVTPPSHFNRNSHSEPHHSTIMDAYSPSFNRNAYSAGAAMGSSRRRTSSNVANNCTSDEYEYEYEYEYQRGPRNNRRLKPRYRNSSIKSRKAKQSPLTSNSKDLTNRRSNFSRNALTIVSSSDSNSGRDLTYSEHTHRTLEDASPISSRHLFNAESISPKSLDMDTMKKKQYSGYNKFWMQLRNRYRRIIDNAYATFLIASLLTACVTFSTVYTLAPTNLTFSTDNPLLPAPHASIKNFYIRRISQQPLAPPRVVLLHDYVQSSSYLRNHHSSTLSDKQRHYRKKDRKLTLYPAEFSDPTQLYSVLDSSDPAISSHMEMRDPYVEGECEPIADWQTTFHPSCNSLHEYDLADVNEKATLFGTMGYWRNAWHLEQTHRHQEEHYVLKTLKYEHRFEDAHYEHDRIDAVAMEMLTSSPHIVDIFGYCGHSVITEYADQPRLGTLADKNKRNPVKLLEIARDIANGVADVHDMGKNGNPDAPNAFVHLDVNPANVVSVQGTLKLNDFNIGIMRKWNTTSNKPCGFPAQYPNPQWRSPEEAWESQNLDEKVDVFSMGHIFFRLICGHEPWHKLEPKGKPTREEIDKKVKNNVLPHIPDEVKHSDNPATKAIYKAMRKCYRFKPENRPSAREIAKDIDRALKVLLEEQSAKAVDGSTQIKKKK